MSLPKYLHSGMAGAPSLTSANGSVNALLSACLVDGFNTQSVSSATCASGVVTFNFVSAPGFSALDTVTIAGASNTTVNGQFRAQSAASNQVLVAIPGVPDGAVGGTITFKFSPLGWTRPYSGTGVGVYRQGGSASHKRYVRVYDNAVTSGGYFYSRGYEAMTAVSSGTGPFPTTTQVTGNGVGTYVPATGTTNAWLIVGTPRAWLLLISDTEGVMGINGRAQYFGDLDRVAKPADVYACVISAGDSWPSYGTHIARPHTGLVGAAAVTSIGIGGQNSFSPGFAYPCVASGGLNLADSPSVSDSATNTHRGFFAGVLSCMQAPVHSVGGSALLPGAILSSISGVSGRALVQGNGAGAVSNCVLLLDEDWGDT